MSFRTRLITRFDRHAGALSCHLLGAWIRRQTPIRDRSLRIQPKRILVIRPGGLGDMLLAVPMLRSVRNAFPEAHVDVICERRNAAALELAGLEMNALCYDARPIHLLRALLSRDYDLCLDTEQFHHFSAIMAWMSGAPYRIGYAVTTCRNPIYTHTVPYELGAHEADQFMHLIEPLGLDDGCGSSRLSGALKEAALPDPPPELTADDVLHIAICPGSTTAYKAWGMAQYTGSIETLLSDPQIRIVLIGGDSDVEAARELMAGCAAHTDRILNLCGALSLAASASALKHCAVFLGSDSGVAHLAASVGTQTVVLFGPSDARKWGLVAERHRVIAEPQACSPCFMFGYRRPCRDFSCMRSISIDRVTAEIQALIERR